MTQAQKRQVKDALSRYMDTFPTQAAAAASLSGISAATLSQICNHNWDLLSDQVWQNVSRQVGFYCGEWQAADTSTSLLLRILFGDAQHYGMSYGIAIGNGLGKTFTALQYMRTHENVLYIAGNEFYNRKSFLTAMLGAANAQATGTAPEMLKQLVGIIESREETLIIVDDAHKLKNRVLHLLVLLANMQAEKTGMIIMGDDLMKTRIVEGVRLKQPGFDEIYKTIGRRFITLNYLAPGDIMSVCNANGLYDPQSISFIQETCGHNLHRATSLIAEQLQQGIAA